MVVYRTLRHFPQGAATFWKRLVTVPFQVALAFTSVLTGIMAFFDATITSQLFNHLLPDGMVVLFNLTYLIAGFAMIAAIGWGYRNLEAFSLILMLMSLIVRFIALLVVAGLATITMSALVQSLIFGFACTAKLVILLKRKDVVLVDLDSPHSNITAEHNVVSV